MLPAEDAIALNRRQASAFAEAAAALRRRGGCARCRARRGRVCARARGAFDRLTGRAGVEDVLDALFGRFCLGK